MKIIKFASLTAKKKSVLKFFCGGKTFPTLDPRTGEVITHVAEGHSEDVDRAVAAARKAFDQGPWPKMTTYHNDEFAALETWDNGKPYEQSAQIEIPMLDNGKRERLMGVRE
ncbi:hypothetical protein HN51_068458 [Arachis hypogaea]